MEVVAVGNNEYGQCDVNGWSGIQLPNNLDKLFFNKNVQQGDGSNASK
jgi:hypothetical protein